MSIQGSVLLEMIKYDEGNVHNINHFIKVHSFAKLIGETEKLDSNTQIILEISALVHDIGIKVCMEKYGSCSGKNQEIEGPAIADQMLRNLKVEQSVIDRVCYLVGHHHTLDKIDGSDYQILVEADFLTNIGESDKYYKSKDITFEKFLKTNTAKEIFKRMYQ